MNRISTLIRPSVVLGIALTLVGCGPAPVPTQTPSDPAVTGFHIQGGKHYRDVDTLINFGNLNRINPRGNGGPDDVLNFGNINVINGRGGGPDDVLNFGNINVIRF